jgi:hypothetical protein
MVDLQEAGQNSWKPASQDAHFNAIKNPQRELGVKISFKEY